MKENKRMKAVTKNYLLLLPFLLTLCHSFSTTRTSSIQAVQRTLQQQRKKQKHAASKHVQQQQQQQQQTSSSQLSVITDSKMGTLEAPVIVADESSPIVSTNTVICGGGPAGLLSAIMMAQKFPEQKIKVFDRLSAPPSSTDDTVWGDYSKFYLIGLGGRGQSSLSKFGVWDKVAAACTAVVGRRDWAPEGPPEGVERIFTDRKYTTMVLPRDKLVSVLYEYIEENYSQQVELNYGYEVQPMDFDYQKGSKVLIQASKCTNIGTMDDTCDVDIDNEQDAFMTIAADFLLAADGTARSVANTMQELDEQQRTGMNVIQKLMAGKPFKVTRYVDDNQRVYKTIPIKLPNGWRPDLNYSARSKDGARINIDALPANNNGEYCGVFLVRKDDVLAQENTDPKLLRDTLDEMLPMFSELLNDETIQAVAKKPPSFLPAFRFVGPRLNQGSRTLIIGDSAHTVKPYFGLGANSALEDVKVLSDCIDATKDKNIPEAVQAYSKKRSKEAKKLVTISRSLDRPGKLGTITFIVPIILDSIFNKLFPKLFAPNVISVLQREDLTFAQVARRKRMDRIGQLSIIGGVLTGITCTSIWTLRAVAKLLGKRTSTVFGGLALSIFGFILLRKMAGFLVPGLAPADVLAKTKSKLTPGEKSFDNEKK